MAVTLLGTAGCLNLKPLPPANLSEPGWTIREGQAVWRMNQKAPELAGEVLVATHADGRTFVQFTKTPFPFVITRTTTNSWQIELPTQNKKYSGSGRGPARMPWLHLPAVLQGKPAPRGWKWTAQDGKWRFEKIGRGEFIEGFLTQ